MIVAFRSCESLRRCRGDGWIVFWGLDLGVAVVFGWFLGGGFWVVILGITGGFERKIVGRYASFAGAKGDFGRLSPFAPAKVCVGAGVKVGLFFGGVNLGAAVVFGWFLGFAILEITGGFERKIVDAYATFAGAKGDFGRLSPFAPAKVCVGAGVMVGLFWGVNLGVAVVSGWWFLGL